MINLGRVLSAKLTPCPPCLGGSAQAGKPFLSASAVLDTQNSNVFNIKNFVGLFAFAFDAQL
jgi:hypothetical protein